MLTINNVETQNDYSEALTLESKFGGRLVYLVANASVVARFRPLVPAAGTQTAEYGQEQVLTPQSSFIDKISGAQFRSAVAGSPGRIVASLSEPGDILPASGTPFTSTLQASGAVGAGLGIYDVITTPVDVESSAAEADLWNKSLPALDFANGRSVLRVKAWGDCLYNRNAADTIRLRARLGPAAPGTLIWDPLAMALAGGISANRRGWVIDFLLSQAGSLSAQRIGGLGVFEQGATLGTGGSDWQATQAVGTSSRLAYIFGSAAQDWSADLVFQLTAQWSIASALNSLRMNGLIAELVSI